MESDDLKIEAIKIKVRNTINLLDIDRNVLSWIERKSNKDPSFRGHYYLVYELVSDIGLIENTSKRNELIKWLKTSKTRDSLIKEALARLELEK